MHNIFLEHDLGQVDHIHKCLALRDPMSDNDRLCYTKNRCATIIFKIEAFEIFVFNLLFLCDLVKLFRQFQHDITRKPFTNHYVGFIHEYVTPFNITREIDVFIFF